MALEDRVKQLEDEIKVLKNEIQTTLLDIQEQILVHYYPALYPSQNNANHAGPQTAAAPPPPGGQSESPAKPQAPPGYRTETITITERIVPESDVGQGPPAPESATETAESQSAKASPPPDPEQVVLVAQPPVSDDNLAPDETDQDILSDAESAVLQDVLKLARVEASQPETSWDEFQEVSRSISSSTIYPSDNQVDEILDDLLADSMSLFNSGGKHRGPANGKPKKTSDRDLRAAATRLLSWVDTSVGRIGKQRTKRAVELYVDAGNLPPNTRSVLHKLIDLSPQKQTGDDPSVKEIIDTLARLNEILDQAWEVDLDTVLTFIEEVNFG